jgi:two-component system, chemotaxis family, chemotaxis protein CheY
MDSTTREHSMNQLLIVDDSPTIRRMVKASLTDESQRMEFVEAGSGLEAIERLAMGVVELMVLDLNMPDMHGLEVLGFVRAHDKYRHVPVIVLTTRGDDSSRTAALQAGATAFMTKPFDPQALALRVRELLRAGAAPGSR